MEGNILEIQGLNKSYPGVQALRNVDISVKQGECHAIVGENGAGKSTLVKIINGYTSPDNYTSFKIFNFSRVFKNPREALHNGIATVQQHTNVVPYMSVADNIYLGHEDMKNRFMVDKKRMKKRAKEFIKELGVNLSPGIQARKLSPGDKRILEICKAKSKQARMMILDEPTAGLTNKEINNLFGLLNTLLEEGITILYISHRLEEIFEIADRVTVLRDGEKVDTKALSEIDHETLSQLITGEKQKKLSKKPDKKLGSVNFKVRNLNNSLTEVELDDISFEARAGEILGIYGIMGAGKRDLCETIFGLSPKTNGEIYIKGKKVDIDKPRHAIENNIGYLTADRQRDGFIKEMTVKQNMTLPSLKRLSEFGKIYKEKEQKKVNSYIDLLDIKTRSTGTLVNQLSGGNQQKVVFAKWLLANSTVLLLNEPTVGVDIGAKAEMFELMQEEAQKGNSVIHLTSEADEILEVADRILLLRKGKIVEELKPEATSENELLTLATKK